MDSLIFCNSLKSMDAFCWDHCSGFDLDSFALEFVDAELLLEPNRLSSTLLVLDIFRYLELPPDRTEQLEPASTMVSPILFNIMTPDSFEVLTRSFSRVLSFKLRAQKEKRFSNTSILCQKEHPRQFLPKNDD